MLYILFAILFFGFLIAIHEFGHFIVAKACGVKVNEYAIGMGPQLRHKQGKETLYSLRLFPVGGYCAMEGEDEDTGDPRSFSAAKGWKRFLILIAGSAMNFLAGLVILLLLYSGTKAYVVPVIADFMEGCPAYEEGYLQVGDEFLRINGHPVWLSTDVSTLLGRGNGETVEPVIRRDGQKLALHDVPLALHEYTEDGQVVQRYGLYFSTREGSIGGNLSLAIRSSADFARMVWFSLEDLVSGRAGVSDLSGPIGIVGAMSDVGESSATWRDALLNLLYFGSFIAVNLAVMNLLPLPALDGGRVFFLILNGLLYLVFRRRIPGKYEGYVHMAGMLLLLALMAFVAIQDIMRLIGG